MVCPKWGALCSNGAVYPEWKDVEAGDWLAVNRNKILTKAQKLLQKGKVADAIKEYELVVENDPADVRTLLKVGDLQAKIGNVEQACDTYHQSHRLINQKKLWHYLHIQTYRLDLFNSWKEVDKITKKYYVKRWKMPWGNQQGRAGIHCRWYDPGRYMPRMIEFRCT